MPAILTSKITLPVSSILAEFAVIKFSFAALLAVRVNPFNLRKKLSLTKLRHAPVSTRAGVGYLFKWILQIFPGGKILHRVLL